MVRIAGRSIGSSSNWIQRIVFVWIVLKFPSSSFMEISSVEISRIVPDNETSSLSSPVAGIIRIVSPQVTEQQPSSKKGKKYFQTFILSFTLTVYIKTSGCCFLRLSVNNRQFAGSDYSGGGTGHFFLTGPETNPAGSISPCSLRNRFNAVSSFRNHIVPPRSG